MAHALPEAQHSVDDERRVLVDLTPAGEALREDVWGVSGKIKTACRPTDRGLAELRDTLDGLARSPDE